MTDILSPVGRLIQGSCFKGNDKDYNKKPYGNNADGTPKLNYFVGLAVEKTNPDLPAFMEKIQAIANAAFPAGQAQYPTFSWKIEDGDVAKPGKQLNENAKGCMIIKFNSFFAPTVWAQGASRQITNPDELKRGYYIQVAGSVKGNGNNEKTGVFMNLHQVMLVGYGEEIAGGPDGSVFGETTGFTPAGMSSTPLAGAAMPASEPQATGIMPGVAPVTSQQPAPGASGPDFGFLQGK